MNGWIQFHASAQTSSAGKPIQQTSKNPKKTSVVVMARCAAATAYPLSVRRKMALLSRNKNFFMGTA